MIQNCQLLQTHKIGVMLQFSKVPHLYRILPIGENSPKDTSYMQFF